MTSYTEYMRLNTNVSIAAPVNDDTLTKILVVDATNNIKYRDVSTISGTYNQNLNTTDNVTFNQVTTGTITSSATNNALAMFNNNINYYTVIITTSDAAFQTAFTFPTTSDVNYTVFAEIACKNISSAGGASFFQSARVTNTAGIVTSSPISIVSNKMAFLGTTATQIVASGTNIIVQVKGVAGVTIKWQLVVRIVSASA